MNQTTQANRAKRIRLADAKPGNKSIRLKYANSLTVNYEKIEAQAVNKTPKAQRVGNYYTTTTNKTANGKVYHNLTTFDKLASKAAKLAQRMRTFNS